MRWLSPKLCGSVMLMIIIIVWSIGCPYGRRARVAQNIEVIEYRNGLVWERILIFELESSDSSNAHIEIERATEHGKYDVVTGFIDACVYRRAWLSISDILRFRNVAAEHSAATGDAYEVRLGDRCYRLRMGLSPAGNDEVLRTTISEILLTVMSGMRTNTSSKGLHYSLQGI